MADDRKADHARILESTVEVPDHVVHRAFEAETLLLNLETGQYHGINETGGRMLELLEDRDGRVRAAIEQLAAEYDVTFDEIAPQLAAFCLSLESRGLIVVREDAA